MNTDKKIAIVVQRYGNEIVGGSEKLAHDLSTILGSYYDVDVLTTCAKDYVTWKDFYPAGISHEGFVTVKRFSVKSFRSNLIFDIIYKLYNLFILYLPHTILMEKLWIRMQGPYSPDLNEYIKKCYDEYDYFIFITYLYATTYYNLTEVKNKSILIPTIHDEPQARLALYQDIFNHVQNVVFLSSGEQSLAESIFGSLKGRGIVIGAPVESINGNPIRFRNKYNIHGEFLLYLGRIDPMKGVQVLINFFVRYVHERNSEVQLVLCGESHMDLPDSDNIRYLGYIDDEDKFDAITASCAVVQPSYLESFSISVIESMFAGTPVIVNGECAVLRDHVATGGGIAYTCYEGFADAVDLLVGNTIVRNIKGNAGRMYAMNNYSFEAVRKKYISLLDGLTTKK